MKIKTWCVRLLCGKVKWTWCRLFYSKGIGNNNKGYKTISYEAMFAISGIPPIDLVILNNLDVRETYLSTSLGTLDGTIPVSLLPHPSCRKPITLVSYTNEVFQEYKTVCFTDGSKIEWKGRSCLRYLRESGNLGNVRADQLALEATCQDVNLWMSVSLSHWKHLAWERTVSSWNTEFLASPKALWNKRFFPTIYQRLKCRVHSEELGGNYHTLPLILTGDSNVNFASEDGKILKDIERHLTMFLNSIEKNYWADYSSEKSVNMFDVTKQLDTNLSLLHDGGNEG
ncbi:transforming growth factor-beta-induced protein ig-h3 [Trichonephila clavipes]|nr:transforming growth factor-beta-induced protein ig-h3 [Trichonephila clavipes]